MGHGDEDLGLSLMSNYLKLISSETDLPKFITFYNSGVRLLCTGSPFIETFKILEAKGVKLIACKTCLKHYQLLSERKMGIEGTMLDIIELQRLADKVINL